MAKDRRRSVEAPPRGAWVVRWEAKQWDFACSIMSYYWYTEFEQLFTRPDFDYFYWALLARSR
jgi:hypothetical protein